MAEILVVEDERVIRRSLEGLLVGEGYSVRSARDGEEALVRIEEHRPDLVLLDVMMPKLNGYATCEAIRRRGLLLPVVFLTAKDAEESQIRALNLGCDGFVSKSAQPDLLLATVRRALERVAKGKDEVEQKALRLGSVRVDLDRHCLVRDGETIPLTSAEVVILTELAAHRDAYLDNEALFDALYGRDTLGNVENVRIYVSRLKAKLGAAGNLIINRSRLGYRLME